MSLDHQHTPPLRHNKTPARDTAISKKPARGVRQRPLFCSPGVQGAVVRAGMGLSPWQGKQDGAGRHWGRCGLLCPRGRCFCQLWAQLGPAAALPCAQPRLPPGRAGAARWSVRAQRSGAGERASSSRGGPGSSAGRCPRWLRSWHGEGRALLLAVPCVTSVCCGVQEHSLLAAGCTAQALPAACLPTGAWPHAGHPPGPMHSIPMALHRASP